MRTRSEVVRSHRHRYMVTYGHFVLLLEYTTSPILISPCVCRDKVPLIFENYKKLMVKLITFFSGDIGQAFMVAE
jgi:hypothetical protein